MSAYVYAYKVGILNLNFGFFNIWLFGFSLVVGVGVVHIRGVEIKC